MRLIWVKRETENFLRGDWTTQITLIARTFSALCRTPALSKRWPRRGATRRGRQRSIAGCLSGTSGPHPITFRSPALFHFAHLPDLSGRVTDASPDRVTCEKCGILMDRRADKSLLTYERIPEDEGPIPNGVCPGNNLRRTPQIVGQRAVRQRFGQMQPADFLRAIEIGQRAGDAQYAVIAARRQAHGFGRIAQQF